MGGWPGFCGGRRSGVMETGWSSVLIFFFGCGSSTVRLRCLDLTGTGIVVRDGAVGTSERGLGSGCGSITGSEWMAMARGVGVEHAVLAGCAGLKATELERWDVYAVMGLRLCSGLVMRRDGRPPWETRLGGADVTGRGTNVWRPRWDEDSPWKGGCVGPSSNSMEGSKKGKSPAR